MRSFLKMSLLWHQIVISSAHPWAYTWNRVNIYWSRGQTVVENLVYSGYWAVCGLFMVENFILPKTRCFTYRRGHTWLLVSEVFYFILCRILIIFFAFRKLKGSNNLSRHLRRYDQQTNHWRRFEENYADGSLRAYSRKRYFPWG